MFHIHKWKIVWSTQGKLGKGWPITLVGYGCTKCPKIKTVQVDGHWTKRELEGAR